MLPSCHCMFIHLGLVNKHRPTLVSSITAAAAATTTFTCHRQHSCMQASVSNVANYNYDYDSGDAQCNIADETHTR